MNLQNGTEGNHNSDSSEPLVKIEQLPGTPFKMVYQEGKYFLAIGNYRLTQPTDTDIEQYDKLESEKWDIILNLIIVVAEKIKEEEEIKNKRYETESQE